MNKRNATKPAVKIASSYRGKIGCMCGCIGTYSDKEARGQRVFADILAAAKNGAKLESGVGLCGPYLATEVNGRTLAVYFA